MKSKIISRLLKIKEVENKTIILLNLGVFKIAQLNIKAENTNIKILLTFVKKNISLIKNKTLKTIHKDTKIRYI